jgi:hypothetical protein
LFLLDAEGQITSRDTSRILPAIRATPDEPAPKSLPPDYNGRVMPVQQLFAQEVRQRNARRDHVLSLTQGQRYALRELRVLFSRTDDEDRKGQIHLLEKAFRLTPTAAVTKELNFLRRNGVVGEALLKSLTAIYHQHRLRDRLDQESTAAEREEIPRIVCSEALTG